MQKILGVLLIVFGLTAVVTGLFTDELGDGGVVSALMGGAGALVGVGLMIRGEMREALFAAAAASFMFGAALGVFRAVF